MLSDDAVGVGVADGIEAYALNIRVLALQENKKQAGNRYQLQVLRCVEFPGRRWVPSRGFQQLGPTCAIAFCSVDVADS